MPGRWLILWLAANAACVVIPNPDHCANKLGDESCSAMGVGWVCSSCARTNNGCVMGDPPEDCRDTATPGSSESDPATGSDPTSMTMTETMSETGDPSCASECGEDAPYCVDAQCVTCTDAGGDAFCEGRDPQTPQCHPSWGHCVECYAGESSACAEDQPFCDDAFACAGCTEHAQCPDSACDLETGECMDDATQLWVDNAECEEPAQGTPESPYCNIADAMAVIGTGDLRAIIHLAGGTPYPEPEGVLWSESCESDRTLAILGFGGTPVLQGDPNVIDVTCGNVLYLSNIRLITGTASGAHCDSASLWIDDSIVRDNEIGIDAVGCRVHVRRTQILSTDDSGIRADDETDLWVSSSIIAGGGDPKLPSRGIFPVAGSVDIRFSTIVDNVGSNDPSFWCAGAVQGIARNNIFGSTGGSTVSCPTVDFVNNAIDDETVAMDGTDNVYVLYQDSWFAGPDDEDYHLAVEPPPGYAMGGIWQPGDPRVDVDRDARSDVPGAVVSVGADVATMSR